MEYYEQALILLTISILTAYALYGWCTTRTTQMSMFLAGDGQVIGLGSYYREENGKPYNSGDPVAGQ